MSQSDIKDVTNETVAKGGILANLWLDMQSERQDDLQPLMTDLVNNKILKTPGVVYCFGSIEEPIKIDNVYSTSAKLTVLVKSISAMVIIAFNYTPAGIELLRPEREYVIKSSDLQTILMDMAQISMDYSKYILEKVMNKEDLAKVQQNMKMREEQGRRLLQKSQEERRKGNEGT